MRRILALLAAIGTLAVAGPVNAAKVVFNTGGSNATTSSKIFVGNDGTKVKVTAFSIDNTGKIVYGTLGQYSGGLGVQSGTKKSADDSHTVDNSGWKDFLLLSFDNYVVLNDATLTTNYTYNNNSCCLKDTDTTVGAAYTYGIQWNANWESLIGQNQSVLNSMGLLTTDSTSTLSTQTRDLTPTDRGGTVWLVGAAFNNPDSKVDGFKFKAVTYSLAAPPPPPVPEPSTWITLILGFGALGSFMRRRNRDALPALA